MELYEFIDVVLSNLKIQVDVGGVEQIEPLGTAKPGSKNCLGLSAIGHG
jgi:hypothetical protein